MGINGDSDKITQQMGTASVNVKRRTNTQINILHQCNEKGK